MKKKLFSLALALVLGLGLAVPAFAAESDFIIENGILIKYIGSGGDIAIPSGVKELGDDTFKNCNELTSVIIPKGVTRIGYDVFFGCKNLSSITIPDTVTYIAHNAFWGCDSLTNITIPGSVETTAGWTFYRCKNLTNATFLDGAVYIGESVFGDCGRLSSVTIPTSVTMIDNGAFAGCSGLKDVYYGGNEAQWKAINIVGTNDELLKAAIHYNASVPNPVPSVVGGFTDVKTSDYFAEAVQWAVEKNITVGTGGGYFSPNATCSRGAIITMIWRANGSPAPDMAKLKAAGGTTLPNSPASAFYYEAVQWACAEGIIPATFNGEVDCTRATALELLWRAAGRPVPVSPANFNDMEPDAPFFDAITWAVEQKITSGTGGGNFSPNAICTRGQIVTFLHRAMGK